MARRCTDSLGQDPQLSRKRTADMLRQLRNLGKDARMLKARIETALDQKDERDRKQRVAGTVALPRSVNTGLGQDGLEERRPSTSRTRVHIQEEAQTARTNLLRSRGRHVAVKAPSVSRS